MADLKKIVDDCVSETGKLAKWDNVGHQYYCTVFWPSNQHESVSCPYLGEETKIRRGDGMFTKDVIFYRCNRYSGFPQQPRGYKK